MRVSTYLPTLLAVCLSEANPRSWNFGKPNFDTKYRRNIQFKGFQNKHLTNRGEEKLPPTEIKPFREAGNKDGVPILNILPSFRLPTVQPFSHRHGEPLVSIGDEVMDTRPVAIRPLQSRQGERHCGGAFSGLGGFIHSPDYPFNYPNNAKCIYTIKAENNYTIGFTCEDFAIQPGEINCEHDYLEVAPSGDWNANDTKKFCGDKLVSVISTGNNMTLVFHSDATFQYKGFRCRYRALNSDGTGVEGSVEDFSSSNDHHNHNHPSICSGEGLGWSGKCGVGNDVPDIADSRIVGGEAVKSHEFPWMVAILKECGRYPEHYCHICGGTIIHTAWILTGAHCLARVPVDKLGVLLGDHNLFTLTPSQKFLRIKDVFIHPDFNVPSPLNNDIALISLPQQIAFSKYVTPICLPPRDPLEFLSLLPERNSSSRQKILDLEMRFGNSGIQREVESTTPVAKSHIYLHQSLADYNVSVYGWGILDDDGTLSQQLRGVSVKILSNEECDYYYGLMTNTMLCTSGYGGRGPCRGDSGSPAQMLTKDGSWIQVGVLAFGAAYGCEVGYPSGNALVPLYVSWIEYVTGIDFSDYP